MRSLGLMATKTFMFLFADIEGSAAMGRRPVDAGAGAGAGYHRLIRAGLAAHGG
jgi:class 3 adenylate cyclase